MGRDETQRGSQCRYQRTARSSRSTPAIPGQVYEGNSNTFTVSPGQWTTAVYGDVQQIQRRHRAEHVCPFQHRHGYHHGNTMTTGNSGCVHQHHGRLTQDHGPNRADRERRDRRQLHHDLDERRHRLRCRVRRRHSGQWRQRQRYFPALGRGQRRAARERNQRGRHARRRPRRFRGRRNHVRVPRRQRDICDRPVVSLSRLGGDVQSRD